MLFDNVPVTEQIVSSAKATRLLFRSYWVRIWAETSDILTGVFLIRLIIDTGQSRLLMT
jgi:hypothetical protein